MSGLRKLRIGTAVAAAIATMLVGPAVASAGPVEDLVDQVSNGVNQTLDGLLGSGGNKPDRKPAPDAQGSNGSEQFYVPPAHGTNPHGQGTIGVLDDSLTTPDPESNPYPYEPGGANETAVIGRSRGEQNPDGTYTGHVTILSLLGTEVFGVETQEGDSEGGPVGDLNDLLDDICIGTGILCLQVLDIDSETDENGSENSFNLASAGIFLGDLGVFAEGGSSRGDISEEGGCQTATGESTVLGAGIPLFEIQAGNSESEATACNDGTMTQENESSVLLFNDIDLLRILDPLTDCENGVPNSPLIVIEFLAAICNADDSSNVGGTQLDAPFGVREAFTLLLIDFLGLGGGFEEGPEALGFIPGFPILLKTTLAAAESFAVAPPEEPPVCPDPNNPECPEPPEPPDGDGDQDGDEPEVEEELTSATDDGPGGPGGPTARTSDDVLPFTGADLGLLALIGAVVMAAGLGGMALSDRRRRATEES